MEKCIRITWENCAQINEKHTVNSVRNPPLKDLAIVLLNWLNRIKYHFMILCVIYSSYDIFFLRYTLRSFRYTSLNLWNSSCYRFLHHLMCSVPTTLVKLLTKWVKNSASKMSFLVCLQNECLRNNFFAVLMERVSS